MTETRTTSSTGGQKGVKLARFDLIPAGPLKKLAEHYGRGARKYDDNQWRQGYEWSKSIGALGRHFNLFMAGEDYDACSNDPEGCSFVDADGEDYEPLEPDTCFNHTGSHHMAAVAWHAFLLLEFDEVHPGHDDRYRPDLNNKPDFRHSVTLSAEGLNIGTLRLILGLPPQLDEMEPTHGTVWARPLGDQLDTFEGDQLAEDYRRLAEAGGLDDQDQWDDEHGIEKQSDEEPINGVQESFGDVGYIPTVEETKHL